MATPHDEVQDVDYRDLEAQAGAIEGQAGAVPGGPPLAPAEDPAKREARELLGALTLARVLVAPMFRWWPEFPQVWCDQTLQGISDSGAAVMVRQGWTMAEVFEKWGPYIGLAMATAPPCVATYQAIQLQKAYIEQQRKAQAHAPAAAPAGGNGHAQ